jgi:hypothetical protein
MPELPTLFPDGLRIRRKRRLTSLKNRLATPAQIVREPGHGKNAGLTTPQINTGQRREELGAKLIMAFDAIKNWIVSAIATRMASLRRIDGTEYPDLGRSSVETTLGGQMAAMLNQFGGVSPKIDFRMLEILEKLWVLNPDFSQYVDTLVSLGNTGHKLTVDAKSQTVAEAALNRLNEMSNRIYKNGAGVDGLINGYLQQIAVFGAISSEDVVDFAGRRVEQVVYVPVHQIRFLYLDGQYVPHQKPNVLLGFGNRQTAPLGLIRLNDQTYHYYALQTIENSPYAKPPASATVDAITGPQKDLLENLKFIAKKFGIVGLVMASLTPPKRKPSETEPEYQIRSTNYLKSVTQALDGNFNNGLVVAYNDIKFEHANVLSDARGAADIMTLSEQQIMSGFGMPPAFFGRTDSTTETYADVVYSVLDAKAGNCQRLPKRRHESTCRLDLRLGGIEVDGISMQFNRTHSRNLLGEMQADQIKIANAITKAKAGIISPDEAAQELGYESCHEESLMLASPDVARALQSAKPGASSARQNASVTFRFDRASQSYRFIPSAIDVTSQVGADNGRVVALKKKVA